VSPKHFKTKDKSPDDYKPQNDIFDEILLFFETQSLIDINILEAKLELILVNKTLRSLTHLSFSFMLSPTGRVSPKLEIESIQNNIFSYQSFLLLFVYFFLGSIVWKTTLTNFINQIKKYFEDINPKKDQTKEDEQKDNVSELKDQSFMQKLFFKLLNYDIDKISSFKDFFIILWNRTWSLLQNWIEAIRIGLVYNTLYLGHLFSFIISLIILVVFFLLLFNSFRKNIVSLEFPEYGILHFFYNF
jgi:hypothetical protein